MIFAFGSAEIDEELLELRVDGARVDLQPKVLELLLFLLRNRARVVTKRELLERLWPDVVVGETSLTRAVSAARLAIGDAGDDQRVIRTHARVGYRFVAPVEERSARGSERLAAASGRAPADAFVGRAELLERLYAAWAGVAAGGARLCLLAGEPGIGKTRTAHELAAHALARGARVLSGWSSEERGAPAYWPFAQMIRAHLRDAGASATRAAAEPRVDELAAIVPELGPAQSPAATGGDADAARFAQLDVLARFFGRLARERPLVLCFDDLHWADRASLRALDFVLRELREAPLLVVATYRPDELAPNDPLWEALAGLARGPGDVHSSLSGLAADEVGALVEAVSGALYERPVIDALCHRTGGNPLFVKELVLDLGEHGAAALAERLHAIPASVRGLVQGRVRRLSPACREALAIAAVCGARCSHALVREVQARGADTTLDALEEAVFAGILRPAAGAPQHYEFAHDVFREALLETQGGAERVRLHRRVAAALEALRADDLDEAASELAAHWLEIARAEGGAEPAARFATRAAEFARRRLAYDEAVVHAGRAVEALELGRAPDAERCEALLVLATARAHAGDPAGAVAAAERAASLARRTGRAEDLARAALVDLGQRVRRDDLATRVLGLLEEAAPALAGSESGLHARVLAQLARLLSWGPRSGLDRALALARQALALSGRLADAGTRRHVMYAVLYAIWPRLSLEERLELTRELIAISEATGDRMAPVHASPLRLTALLEAGDLAAVDEEIDRHSRRIDAFELPAYFLWYRPLYRGMRLLLSGRLAEAEPLVWETFRLGQRAIAYDAQQGFAGQIAQLRIDQGRSAELEPHLRAAVGAFPWDGGLRAAFMYVLCEIGKLDEARALFEREAREDFLDPERDLNACQQLFLLAHVCAELGDAARAERLRELLAPFAERTAVNLMAWSCSGSVHWPLAKLAALCGRADEAASHYEAAIARNQELDAATYLARTQLDYASFLRRRGRPRADQARGLALVREVARSARAMGMSALAARADALLVGDR